MHFLLVSCILIFCPETWLLLSLGLSCFSAATSDGLMCTQLFSSSPFPVFCCPQDHFPRETVSQHVLVLLCFLENLSKMFGMFLQLEPCRKCHHQPSVCAPYCPMSFWGQGMAFG